MSRRESMHYDSENTVYIRFPCQNNELNEEVVNKLLGQFGGLRNLTMTPDKNFAFAVYKKPEYALYVCELLNGINFMNGTLVVKPRDNTRNADIFRSSQYARPRQYPPVFYNQLERLPFEQVDPRLYLKRDDS
ncbi:hypothetical protein M3Y97_00519400 [Aphelenchoides bicaudatus]|nr:hypothetical protein M3Y97_00519400 [Aphelenchoides bicaudatus]